MGDSLAAVMKKSKARLDRKIDRAQERSKGEEDTQASPEVLEAMIRCEELNQQSKAIESGYEDTEVDQETEIEDPESPNARNASVASNFRNETDFDEEDDGQDR